METDLSVFIEEFSRKNKIENQKILDEFTPYGFFNETGNLTLPIIIEEKDNQLYSLSNKITDKLLAAFVNSTNTESLKASYGFRNDSEAIVIFYHEVMWDVLNLLIERQMVRMPIAFEFPDKAKPADIAGLCFLTVKKD